MFKLANNGLWRAVNGQGKCSEGVWMPQERIQKIDQFRMISLLSISKNITALAGIVVRAGRNWSAQYAVLDGFPAAPQRSGGHGGL